MRRFVSIAAITALAALPLSAQQTTVPPAAPTIGASGGFGGGIALPVGNIAKTNAAGYLLEGLVDFSAADQPFSFRLELAYQRFDQKANSPGAGNLNLMSLGGSLLARKPKGAASAYAEGGIAVYHSHLGTKPGISVGGGLDVPLMSFVGFADVRVHYVLTDKPTVTLPITLGARL